MLRFLAWLDGEGDRIIDRFGTYITGACYLVMILGFLVCVLATGAHIIWLLS